MIDEVRRIDISQPPDGWLVTGSLGQFARLPHGNVRAATYIPQNPSAALAFCIALETMLLPPHRRNAYTSVLDLGNYHAAPQQAGGIAYQEKRGAGLPLSSQPLKDAYAEYRQVGAAIAAAFVDDGHAYVTASILRWQKRISMLHTDDHGSDPVTLVHVFCLRPTVVQLDGQLWQGPPGMHNCFKGDLPHRADAAAPDRPHVQAGHYVRPVTAGRLLD